MPLRPLTYRDVRILLRNLVCEAHCIQESGVVTVAGRNAHAFNNYAVQQRFLSPRSDTAHREREQSLRVWEQELRLREDRLVEREHAVKRKEAELGMRGKQGARRDRTRKRGASDMIILHG